LNLVSWLTGKVN